jgi:gluconolactonase
MSDHPIPAFPGLGRRAFLAGSAALLGASALRAEARPTVRRLSPALDRIVAPGAEPEVIATGIQWAEGPVWVAKGGYLLFSDPPANIMRKWRPGGAAEIFLSPSGAGGTDPAKVREPGSNGLALDHAGHLLIANSGGRSIDRLDLATRRRTVLVGRYRGKRFNSPNDLHVARSGAVYFTDPPYGLADGDTSSLKELPHNGVYRWMPGGEAVLVDGGLTRPNGVALSPDERRLYVSVSDEQAPRIMAYDLDSRGMPTGSRVWLDAKPMLAKDAPGLPDGMKVGRDGTLFCAVPGGMMIMTPEAEPLGLIVSDGPIANCAFGEGGRTLFMTSSHRILSLPLARAMA